MGKSSELAQYVAIIKWGTERGHGEIPKEGVPTLLGDSYGTAPGVSSHTQGGQRTIAKS